MARRNRNEHARDGFTLIELLVILLVIGLLVALLLPAVQSAREAARRVQCVNNLRQIGLALHGYLDTHSVFPAGSTGGYSFQVMILPFLDQAPVYHAINFQISDAIFAEHRTVVAHRIATYLCPSDSIASGPNLLTFAPTSYAGCQGVALSFQSRTGVFDHDMFGGSTPFGLRDVTDGASSTVAASEWLIGARGNPERLRAIFNPTMYLHFKKIPFDQFLERCRNLDHMLLFDQTLFLKGIHWHLGGGLSTLYNHNMRPNENTCYNTAASGLPGSISASSHHAGGCNTLRVDGSVHFTRDSIELATWRALGTRALGEIVSGDGR